MSHSGPREVYLDRQSFPVVVGEIKQEIPITTEEHARLGSLFLLAYAVMYAVGGRISSGR